MNGPVGDQVRELLKESLAAWGVTGEVCSDPDGTLLITCGGKELRIARVLGDAPLRWIVSDGARKRGSSSIGGLLRTVRALVDPGYQPIRLRIAPLPVVPP